LRQLAHGRLLEATVGWRNIAVLFVIRGAAACFPIGSDMACLHQQCISLDSDALPGVFFYPL